MSFYLRLTAIACFLSGALLTVPLQLPAQISDDLNVLFIVCDDLNDFEGAFGGHPQAQTPHMDALAAQSVQFMNAHSNAPICGPSRTSFISGLYPHTSNNYAFENWYNAGKSNYESNPILENSKTLMRYMRDNGYKAFRTGKIMHHDIDDDYVYPVGHREAGNLQQDWDETGAKSTYGPVALDPNANGGDGEAVNHPKIPNGFYEVAGELNSLFASLADVPTVNGYTGWWRSGWKAAGAFNYVDDDNRDDMQDEEVRKWAAAKINELAEGDPSGQNERFFMAVGFHNPHTPFVAPQAYFDRYPIETLQLPPRIENDVEDTYFRTNLPPSTSTLEVYSSMLDSVGEAAADGTVYETEEDFLKAYLQAYLACVSFVDDQVGALLEALDNSPYANNTIVILTSDHGYEWGEKEALSKNTLWENSTRVPLLIRVPGLEANAGKQVDVPVSLIDLYPTIKDLSGLTADTKHSAMGAELDGHSLKPFLIDPDTGEWEGPDVALTMVCGNESDEPGAKNFAVRSKDWRYIRYENGQEELYDVKNDPFEFTNLIGSTEADVRANYEFLVNELLTLVPELASAGRNLLIDPGFEWQSDASKPDSGDEPWETDESAGNPWQIAREGSIVRSGRYALKFNQRWTASPLKQGLSEPLDTDAVYTFSFWMYRGPDALGGLNDTSVDLELWSSGSVDGTYTHRVDVVTGAQNSAAGIWEQFSGSFDASALAPYEGEFFQFRIVRNENVKQRIYLDDFVMDGYVPNTFAQWAYERGLNQASYAYDMDGDGLSALEEYAFGGDPSDVASQGHLPEVVVGDSGVTFRYPMRKDGGLSYSLEHTSDLTSEFWSTGGFVLEAPTEEYDADYWKVEGTMNSQPDSAFMRVKADF